jgi:hypothetical protein
MMKRRPNSSHSRQRVRRPAGTRACRRRNPPWDRRAFYSRMTANNRHDWRRIRLTLRPGLERDTQLMPWLMADTVCSEVARRGPAGSLDALPQLLCQRNPLRQRQGHDGFCQLLSRHGNKVDWVSLAVNQA